MFKKNLQRKAEMRMLGGCVEFMKMIDCNVFTTNNLM